MRCSIRALALGAACLAAATAGHAQEPTGTLAKIKESGTITLGHGETNIPFSYIDDRRQAIGYSVDLCAAVVEEVKKELSLATLTVRFNPVTVQTRVALVENGTIDLECGSTINTLTRQKQVAFAPTTFITGMRLAAKKNARIKGYKDLRGKTVAVTQGTPSERALKALSDKENLGIRFFNAKDHAEGFATVEAGRSTAFAQDELQLHALVAKAKNPKDFEVVGDYLSYDPMGLAYRRNDDAFGLVVRRALTHMMRTGEIQKIYDKWFVGKLPSGESLAMPLPPLLKAAFQVQAVPE